MLNSCQRHLVPPEYQCIVQKKFVAQCLGDSSGGGGRQVEQIPCCPYVHTLPLHRIFYFKQAREADRNRIS